MTCWIFFFTLCLCDLCAPGSSLPHWLAQARPEVSREVCVCTNFSTCLRAASKKSSKSPLRNSKNPS